MLEWVLTGVEEMKKRGSQPLKMFLSEANTGSVSNIRASRDSSVVEGDGRQ